MSNDHQERLEKAITIVQEASITALAFFRDIESLNIEQKGVQDLVSNADTTVEFQIRDALNYAFPEDGIIGEEHENTASDSGFTWVIDPIDGTANFVCGTPGWCVVLACVKDDEAIIGVIRDAVADETFIAVKGRGATLNGKKLKVSASASLADGSTGVGYSNRTDPKLTIRALSSLMYAGGVFYRNASGALMLCYVAAGRLIGYCEPHMNAWDCVAAMLIIEEAGGQIYPYNMAEMLTSGARIVAAGPAIYPQLLAICEEAYDA